MEKVTADKRNLYACPKCKVKQKLSSVFVSALRSCKCQICGERFLYDSKFKNKK